MSDLLNGIIIGLGVSIPLGPIGILCLSYALSYNLRVALAAGFGAALADTLYATLATFGQTTFNKWMIDHTTLLGFLGGGILLFLGTKIILAPPIQKKEDLSHEGELMVVCSTFSLTITNPLTLIGFATVFGCFSSIGEMSVCGRFPLIKIIGVFLGSMSWWIVLSSIATLLKNRIDLNLISKLLKGLGVFIIGFALLMVGRLFLQ